MSVESPLNPVNPERNICSFKKGQRLTPTAGEYEGILVGFISIHPDDSTKAIVQVSENENDTTIVNLSDLITQEQFTIQRFRQKFLEGKAMIIIED